MNTYIKILLVASALFFSCAVQSPPTGGASDIRGPYIKKIIPVNGTSDLDKKQIRLTKKKSTTCCVILIPAILKH